MKNFKIFICFLLLINLIACTKISEKDYQTIQEKLINMESYFCKGNVEYISNKGKTKYDINHFVKKDGKYIIKTTSPKSFDGNIILFDGNILWQYNPKLDSKISIGNKDKLERKELSIFSFLENHTKSKDIALQTSSIKDDVYTILEAKIPGTNRFFQSEKLWINNKSKSPEKLIIYDYEGKERVIFNIEEFEYNKPLQDDIFKIENIEKLN